jgi:hypothetical protein
MSSDRSRSSALVSNRTRYTSGEGYRNPMSSRTQTQISKQAPDSTPTTSRSKVPTHARSLSASGTAEFFGRNRSYGVTGGQKFAKGVTTIGNGTIAGGRSAPNPVSRTSGKNTWNGYGTGPRTRNRPNLFQQDIFNGQSARTPQFENQSEESSNPVVFPDLAACIKRALELDSDQDKISHIELVIKQFEQQKSGDQSPTSIDREAVSLPFISCPDQSFGAKSLTINKRKENGMTKIPKPNFY